MIVIPKQLKIKCPELISKVNVFLCHENCIGRASFSKLSLLFNLFRVKVFLSFFFLVVPSLEFASQALLSHPPQPFLL
jgi:hypothetical protein